MKFFLTHNYAAPKPSRLFWICHFSAWGIFGLVDALSSKIMGASSATVLFALFLEISINTATCLKLRQLIHGKEMLTDSLSKIWSKLLLYSLILGFIAAVNIRVPIDLFMWLYGDDLTEIPFYVKIIFNTISFSLLTFIWGLIYVSVKYSNQLKEAKQASDNLALELRNAQLNTLMAQLNPHFLFNALNNIRGLMLEDVPRSRDMLTRLAEMLRYSLLSEKQEFETLENELKVVRAYINVASIQYEERLEFKEDIDLKLLDSVIPPMIIQMMVENAVKYGIDQTLKGGVITLSVSEKDGQMLIQISNPGSLDSVSPESTGLGLINIRKRLELLYGDKASFNISQRQDGVSAIVTLPLSVHRLEKARLEDTTLAETKEEAIKVKETGLDQSSIQANNGVLIG